MYKSHTSDTNNFFNYGNFDELLKEKLKKAITGGYSKGSVYQFVEELHKSSENMRINLEKQIEDLLDEKATISRECSLLRNQLSDVEKKSCDEKNELEELLKISKSETETLEEQIQQFQSENENLITETNQNKINKEEFVILEGKLADKERLLAEKEDQLNKLTERLHEGTQQIEILENQLNQLNELDALRGSAPEEDETVSEHNRSSAEDDRFNELQSEFEENLKIEKDKVKAVQDENMELSKKNENLQSQITDEQTRVKLLRKQLMESQKEYDNFETKYDSLHNNYTSTLQKYDLVAAEKDALSDLLQKYHKKEQEYALLYKHNEEYRNTILSLDKAINLVLDEMQQQAELFSDAVSQYNEGEAKIYDLVQEKTKLQMANADLLNQINTLNARLLKAEQEKDKLEWVVNISKTGDSELELQEEIREELKEAPIIDVNSDFKYSSNKTIKAVERANEIGKVFSIYKEA